MTSQTILPCAFKNNLCLYCGDTSIGECKTKPKDSDSCEGFVMSNNDPINPLMVEVYRLEAELVQAKRNVAYHKAVLEMTHKAAMKFINELNPLDTYTDMQLLVGVINNILKEQE